MSSATAIDWFRILEAIDVDDPSVGQVAEALEDARGIANSRAFALVEGAIDDGELLEDDGAGMFGAVRLPEPVDDQDVEDDDVLEADHNGEAIDAGASFDDIFRRAQEIADVEQWAYVPEGPLTVALDEAGFRDLLETGQLHQLTDWNVADLSDDPDEPEHRYYYTPAAPETRPDEFRRFHELLTADAPADYEPYYFRVETAGKAPATQYGSWKDETNRLTFDQALEHMENGGNIGIAGTPDDPLVNIDVDDGEATTPADLPESIRVRSRSRGESFHTWGFDPTDDVPNLPTDDLGEVRTTWQYVVAPGSFVASDPSEIPDGAENAGYYTVEHESTVPTITYDDLPEAFREWEAEQEEKHSAPPTDVGEDVGLTPDGEFDDVGEAVSSDSTRSAVFDVTAREIARTDGESTDVSDRWSSIFHGSGTSANMSISDQGRLQCWRHNVAHGGLQALAVMSSRSSSSACSAIGTGHKHSNAGPCRYKGDWRLVWWAWEYAKGAGYIPKDDPIPYRALLNLAVRDGIVERDELIERESDDGGSYLGFPDGETYNKALEHVESEYGRDPGREPTGSDGEAVSALPVEQLDALSPDERRRAAKKRGLEWPTTDEARDRLRDEIVTAIRAGRDVVLDAPTSLGKSHTVATEPWTNHAGTTGEQPVIHLAPTRDARDENVAKSDGAGVSRTVLLGRSEACPVAAGDHDPNPDGEDPEFVVTIDGMPASEWLDYVCDEKKVPFSVAHQYLENNHDQGYTQLPCSGDVTDEGGECPAIAQWKDVPRYEDGPAKGDPRFDVIHATHQFAYVPSLIRYCNVVIDEQPDFSVELSQDRVRRMVSAFLQEIGAPATTFEAFVSLARHDAAQGDAAKERDRIDSLLDTDPRREWFLEHPDAHALAPGLARALWFATKHGEPDENGRMSWTLKHEPPRFDVDEERGGHTWLTVVVDEQNTIRSIRNVPAFTLARSIVGLDAHPSAPMWERNVHSGVETGTVLERDERRLWRRYERGLTVVQVGDYTRPIGSDGRYYDERGDRALMAHLRDRYGDEFSTGITGKKAADRFEEGLEAAGVDEPEIMTYGSEKSRDDFGEESVGLVSHCIDPGDDFVLDLLAELGVDAWPERSDTECPACGGDGCSECNGTGLKRAHGRGFDGPEADTAAAILASVRENHVAQAVGRYARSPDDDENTATVFMRTDAAPVGFADVEVSGVEWVSTDRQREIIEELRNREHATARELADGVGTAKRYVFDVLERLEESGSVTRNRSAGAYNADVFTAGDGPVDEVDLGDRRSVSNPVKGPNTWSLILRDLDDGDSQASVSFTGAGQSRSAAVGGDPPPHDAD